MCIKESDKTESDEIESSNESILAEKKKLEDELDINSENQFL